MRIRALAVLLIALAFAVLAAAQDDPLYATGDQIYSAYNGGAIDHVDLLNGNLSVNIPLMSYPQQGGVLPLQYSFHFQTGPAMVTEYCDAEGDPCTEDDPLFNTGFILGPQGAAFMGQYATGGTGYTGDWSSFFTISADGMHQFAPASGSNMQQYNNLWRALDASGLLLNFDGADRGYSITGPHGVTTQFASANWGKTLAPNQESGLEYVPYVATTRSDASGNTITTQFGGEYGAVSGWTDSLGRTIPAPVADTPAASDPYPCPVVAGQPAVSSSYSWNFPGPPNTATPNLSPVKICMTDVYEEYDYYDPNGPGSGWGDVGEVQSIVLPNGTSWQFSYASDDTGTLTQIAFPAGGTIQYTWMPGPVDKNEDYCSYLCFGSLVHTRTVSAGGGAPSEHWSYQYSYSGTDPYAYPTFTTVVTNPDGGTATHTFQSLDYMSPYETSVVYAGSGETRTVATSYQSQKPFDGTTMWPLYKTAVNVVPAAVTTTWGSTGDTSVTSFSYDSASFYPPYYTPGGTYMIYGGYAPWTGTLGEVTSKNESGLRITNTQYEFQSNPGYLNANLLTLPSSVQITDGNGVQRAGTSISYDQGSSCVCGLPTTTATWVAGNSFLTSTSSYNAAGEAVDVVDAAGGTTRYDYAAPCYAASGPTAVTNALNQVTSLCYDTNTGLETAVTDANGQTTTAAYDNMRRTTRIVDPATAGGTGETDYTYSDTPGNVWMETRQKIDATRWTDGYDRFDGLGRPAGHSQFNDAGGSTPPWDRVDESYNASGELAFRSYPCWAASATGAAACTAGDTFAYDDFARPTLTTLSDGTTLLTSYAGFATETQDEGNGSGRVTKVTQTDALGRLASVCEVTGATDAAGNVPTSCGLHLGATGFLTSYAYNALGDLIAVTQGAEQRTFGYDGLSRLTGALNPESGTTTYVYDTDANCTGDANFNRAGDLASRTGARGIRTCYAHDALHRLTGKTYSDGTPTATFNYDQASAFGYTSANPVGRLTSESAGTTAGVFGFDAMGRVVGHIACFSSNCSGSAYTLNYGYDLAGNETSASNGFGVTLGSAYNAAGRLTSLTSSMSDGSHPGTLASGLSYEADGQLAAATLGNGVSETRGYDGRGRLTSLADGSAYSAGLGLASDGAVLTASDSSNGTWSCGYDAENRLTASTCTANCPDGAGTQGFSYSYDRFGNRWTQTVTAGTGPAPSASFTGSTNRMNGYTYDAAGDLLNDGAHSYAYDAEHRLVSVDNGSTASYVYNAEGQRVAASVGGVAKQYLRGLEGTVVAEMDNGAWTRGEAYAGGRRWATYANATTYFNYQDALGTARVTTQYGGGWSQACASLPFGDAQACTGGTPPSPLHFTGKPRDSESGLDDFGARSYSSQWGRFMTPDWSADPEPVPYADLANPQSLNLYAYAGNNPTTNTDADGHREDLFFTNGSSWEFDTDADYAAFWKEWNGWDGKDYPTPGNSGYVTWNGEKIGYAYWSQDNPNWARAVYDSIGRDIAAEKAETIGTDVRSLLMLGAPGGDIGEAAEAGEAVIEGVSKLADLENLSPKIVRQMGSRGWTADEIAETIKSGKQFEVVNKATGGRAIEYFNESSGRFVVVDRTTGKILQVSGEGFLPNHLQP